MSKGFIIVLILTVVSTIAWVNYGGLHSFKTSPRDSLATKTVRPLNPQLRIDIAQDL